MDIPNREDRLAQTVYQLRRAKERLDHYQTLYDEAREYLLTLLQGDAYQTEGVKVERRVRSERPDWKRIVQQFEENAGTSWDNLLPAAQHANDFYYPAKTSVVVTVEPLEEEPF